MGQQKALPWAENWNRLMQRIVLHLRFTRDGWGKEVTHELAGFKVFTQEVASAAPGGAG
jgi:hypothetical protein